MTDVVDIGLSIDSRDVDKASSSLGRMSKESGKLAKAMKSLAIVAGLAAVFKQVADAQRQYTKALSELSAITGATGRQLEYLDKTARQLGRTTTFSANEIVTAFKLVASAKPDLLESSEALAQVTKNVLTLAEASGMELSDAAKTLGGSLNQFNAGAEESARFMNVLAAGAKFGASEIQDTAVALKNVGAVSASLNLTFEETNAAIQALANVSIKGGEAGTGLRGALLKLTKQSRSEFNPEMVGLAKAFQNLQAANLTTTEKMELFGLESITAATALIEQADSLDVLTKKLTGTTTAFDQARTNVDNLDGDIKEMGSAWESVSLTLGKMFDPALRTVVQLMGFAGKSVETVILQIEKAIASVTVILAALWEALSGNFDRAGAALDSYAGKLADIELQIAAVWETDDEQLEKQKQKEETDLQNLETQKQLLEVEQERAALKAAAEEETEMNDMLDTAIMEEEQLARQSELDARKLEEKKAYWDNLYNLETGSQEAIIKFNEGLVRGNFTTMARYGALAFSNSAKTSKKMFAVQKAFALANAAVNLPDAIVQSYRNAGGFPWGILPAAKMALAGAAQISKIKSSTFGSSPSGSTSAGGGGSPTIPTPTLPEGSTATPEGLEEEEKRTVKEIRINDVGTGIHSEALREFALSMAETLQEMGSDTRITT